MTYLTFYFTISCIHCTHIICDIHHYPWYFTFLTLVAFSAHMWHPLIRGTPPQLKHCMMSVCDLSRSDSGNTLVIHWPSKKGSENKILERVHVFL